MEALGERPSRVGSYLADSAGPAAAGASRWLEVVAWHKHQLLELEELLDVLAGRRSGQKDSLSPGPLPLGIPQTPSGAPQGRLALVIKGWSTGQLDTP